MRQNRILILAIIILLLLIWGQTPPLLAYVMESASYRLQQDSINFYGGLGTSTSYTLEDTGGEIATGDSASASYRIHAGYQQSPSYISISAPGAVSLLPAIAGTGSAAGQGDVTVTTDDPAGYTLQIKASTAPAMQSGAYSFADYTPGGGAPDLAWSVAAADSEFGFSPEGSHIVQRYKDDGADCNAGANNSADTCWGNLTTTDATISQSTGANDPAGTATTLKFKAEAGASHLQTAGTYTATITVTAFVN